MSESGENGGVVAVNEPSPAGAKSLVTDADMREIIELAKKWAKDGKNLRYALRFIHEVYRAERSGNRRETDCKDATSEKGGHTLSELSGLTSDELNSELTLDEDEP